MNIFWILLSIPVIALAMQFIWPIVSAWWHQDGGHAYREAAFFEDARRRGLTHAEACNELVLRENMAKLRRVASERVAADPDNWIEILGKTKEESVKWLSYKPTLAKRFAKSLEGLSYAHILWGQAFKAAEARIPRYEAKPPSEDRIAALRTVRPN